jgi:hypothetical protein
MPDFLPDALTPSSQPGVRFVGRRLVVRDPAIFGGENDANARRLLERAFSLPEVQTAVVRSELGLIDLVLDPLADPSHVWRRLGALLRQPVTAKIAGAVRAYRLPLRAPTTGLPIRVHRAVCGWLRIAHPLLRRREVRARLHALLRSTYGVEEVRTTRVWASILVVYDHRVIEADQLLRLLDDSWSYLLQGPAVAPRTTKLATAGGLVALAFTAQFFRPALLPWATAAVAVYSMPNLLRAIRDLRFGQIGVPAMASVSLGFLLWTGLPFASSAIAALSQLWPALANGLAARIEHRLFAGHHQRLAWAQLAIATDTEARVELLDLRPGTTVWARKGDTIPVDGTILEGLAAIDERARAVRSIALSATKCLLAPLSETASSRSDLNVSEMRRLGLPYRVPCLAEQFPACPQAPTRSASQTETQSLHWSSLDLCSWRRVRPDYRRSRSVQITRPRRGSARIYLRCGLWRTRWKLGR